MRRAFYAAAALVAVAALVVLVATRAEDAAEPQEPITAPGVDRLGTARAEQVWRQLPTSPGVRGVECAPQTETCTIRFSGGLWGGMDHGLRRETTMRYGIAAAHAERARWTDIVDAASGRRLARYTARSDNVRVD